MEPSVVVAIISVIIGFVGFVFGVYKHFSTRQVARLLYEVNQMSDYNVPVAFLGDMTSAPVAVLVESSGSKNAQNVVVEVKAKTEIEEYKIEPEHIQFVVDKEYMKASVQSLNPTQTLKLFLKCKGTPNEDQIESINITHAEGVGLNKRSAAYSKISFHILFSDFVYDLNSRTLKIVRFGPWRSS